MNEGASPPAARQTSTRGAPLAPARGATEAPDLTPRRRTLSAAQPRRHAGAGHPQQPRRRQRPARCVAGKTSDPCTTTDARQRRSIADAVCTPSRQRRSEQSHGSSGQHRRTRTAATGVATDREHMRATVVRPSDSNATARQPHERPRRPPHDPLKGGRVGTRQTARPNGPARRCSTTEQAA